MQALASALPVAAPARRSVAVETLELEPVARRPSSSLRGALLVFAAAAVFAVSMIGKIAPAPAPAIPKLSAPVVVRPIVPIRNEPEPEHMVPFSIPDASPAAAPAAQAPPPAARERYIEVGAGGGIEDFPLGDEFVSSCVFGTPEFPYQVAGDSFEAVVDGRRMRVAYQPSSVYPGARKAVIRAPGLLAPHSIVFKVVYDLGEDGLAPLEIENSWDGQGGFSTTYRTSFGRTEATYGRARLRVK